MPRSRSFANPNRRVTASNADTLVYIEVDSFDTDQMLMRVWDVLRGERLEEYLSGPAHDHLEEEIVQRFAYEGDSRSGNWPPLAEATMDLRQRMGFSADEINIRTGEMFQTLVEEYDVFATGASSAEMILPGSAADDGAVAEKIKTAQQGRTSNPMPNFGPTPPRPVLAVDTSDMQELLERLSRWIIWEVSAGFVG